MDTRDETSGHVLRLARDLFSGLTKEHPEGTPYGKFLLIDELGRGGSGTVHLAWDQDLRRNVALKFVELDSKNTSAQRFQREARAAAALNHPGIVRINGFGEIENRNYIEMEYVEGPPLHHWMRQKEPPLRERIRVLHKVAEAIHYAHGEGVIHRDIKPANIIMDDQNEPHVIDFGLAAIDDRMSMVTETGTIMGTPSYMAPEQVKGEDPDPRTDLYSLGVTMYELLTEEVPFVGANIDQLMIRVIRQEPVPPSRRAEGVHPDLEVICLKAMEKTREARFDTVGAFAAELDRFLKGEPILTRPPGTVRRIARKIRRNPLITVLATAAVVFFLAGLIGISLVLSGAGTEQEIAGLMLDAERKYGLGQYAEVETVAKKILALEEHHPGGMDWLARLKLREYTMLRGVPETRVVRGRILLLPQRHESKEEEELRKFVDQHLKGPLGRGMQFLWAGDYKNAGYELHGVEAWEAEFHLGIVQYLSGEFEKARELLGRHRSREPELITPVWIRAVVALAHEKEQKGEDSIDLYVLAEAEARQLGGDRGRLLEAWARVAHAAALRSRGRDPTVKLQDTIESVRTLTTPEAHSIRGDAWLALAEYRASRGKLEDYDPKEFTNAIDAYTEGLAGYAPAYARRAEARLARYEYRLESAREDKTDIEYARQDYESAVQLDAWDAEAATGLATTELKLEIINLDWYAHKEATAAWVRAIETLETVIDRFPDYLTARYRMAVEYVNLSAQLPDPTSHLRKAIEILDEVLSRNPGDHMSHKVRAGAWNNIGNWKYMKGGDATEEFAESEKSLRRSLEINPRYFPAVRMLGRIHLNRGNQMKVSGGDAIGEYVKGIKQLNEAILLNPLDAEAFWLRAGCRLMIGTSRSDGVPEIEAALEDYDRAIEINPRKAAGYRLRAIGCTHLIPNLVRQQRDAVPRYREALRDMESYTQLRRKDPQAYFLDGGIALDFAQYLKGRGSNYSSPLARARASLEEAVRLSPNHAESHTFLGISLILLSENEAQESVRESLQKNARKHLNRAMELSPGQRDTALGWIRRLDSKK